MLKLFYITDGDIPSSTAHSVHVAKMCQAFQQIGCDVTLVCPSQDAAARGEGEGADALHAAYGIRAKFTVRRIPHSRRLLGNTLFAFRAMRVARAAGADLVFSRALYAAFWANVFRTPMVLEWHQPPRFFAERLLLNLSRRLPYVLTVVVITEALARLYRDWGWPAERLVTLSDAVDIDGFPNPVFAPERPGPQAVIGYSGHLYDGRGIDIILAMAKELRESRFVLIGGIAHDVDRWERRASVLRLTNVEFVGFRPNSELPKRLLQMDILLMPYQKVVRIHGNRGNTVDWMSPMKMFEYMATGKPIISSDLPVLREVLQHGHNAMLVPADDAAAWVGAVRELLRTPGLARRLGETAYRQVCEKHDWRKRAQAVLTAIQVGPFSPPAAPVHDREPRRA